MKLAVPTATQMVGELGELLVGMWPPSTKTGTSRAVRHLLGLDVALKQRGRSVHVLVRPISSLVAEIPLFIMPTLSECGSLDRQPELRACRA